MLRAPEGPEPDDAGGRQWGPLDEPPFCSQAIARARLQCRDDPEVIDRWREIDLHSR